MDNGLSTTVLPCVTDEEIQIMSINCQNKKTRCDNVPKMYLVAFSALFFPLSMGMSGAFSAVGTDNMKRRESWIHPTEDEVTWIGSLLALGALCGGAIAGYATERFGRKGAMMIYSLPMIAGALFIAYASDVKYIYTGRFLSGFSGGAICAVTPAYLAEIATPDVRGMLGSLFQVTVGCGLIIGTSFGFFLTWSWQAVASTVSIFLGLATISFMPESPQWLISNNQRKRAIRALKFLYGPDFDAESECAIIEEHLSLQPQGKVKLRELLKPEIYKPLILSLGIIIFQQLCGTNALLYYAVDDFKRLSVPISPYGATVLLNATLTVSTLGSGYLLDRLGRKILLVASGLGMALTLFILAGFTYAMHSNAALSTDYSSIPLIDIFAYIMTFSIGFGPIPWLMISEISPNRVRGLITGVSSAFCWGFVFLVTKSVDFLNTNIGYDMTYCLYGGFSLLSCVFTVLCLPETKGKRFEEIQEFFEKKAKHKIEK